MVYVSCEYFEGTDGQADKDLMMYRIIEWLNPDYLHVDMKKRYPTMQSDVQAVAQGVFRTAVLEKNCTTHPLSARMHYEDVHNIAVDAMIQLPELTLE